MRKRLVLTTIWTVAAWLLVLPAAQAYVDPGSTSVIFQALVAGFAAIGTGLAVFWSRIRNFFRRKSSEPSDSRTDVSDAS